MIPSSRAMAEPGRLPFSYNWTASRLNSGVNCLRVPIGHLLGGLSCPPGGVRQTRASSSRPLCSSACDLVQLRGQFIFLKCCKLSSRPKDRPAQKRWFKNGRSIRANDIADNIKLAGIMTKSVNTIASIPLSPT